MFKTNLKSVRSQQRLSIRAFLIEKSKSAQAGEVLTFAEVMSATGISAAAWSNEVFHEARRSLYREGIYWEKMIGVGARFMTTSETAHLPRRGVAAIGRKARRIRRDTELAPVEIMAPSDKLTYYAARTIAAAVEHATSSAQLKKIEATIRPDQPQLSATETLTELAKKK